MINNMNNSDGVEQYPEFACYYYNERDPRGCVCGKDRTQCGKKVCVANLATMQGKFFCSMYILLVIGVIVFGLIRNGLLDGGKK